MVGSLGTGNLGSGRAWCLRARGWRGHVSKTAFGHPPRWISIQPHNIWIAAVQLRRVWNGDAGPLGPRLCRILHTDFGERPF